MKKGFTLIEMLIVITIVGIILPTFFTIVFSLLRQQARVYQMAEIKKEGDNVLTFLNNEIHEGHYRISRVNNLSDPNNEVCSPSRGFFFTSTGADFFLIKDELFLNEFFRIFPLDGVLRYESSKLGDMTDLTSDNVVISDFQIECYLTSTQFGAPIVGISFRVTHSRPLSPNEPALSLFYSTKYKLRAR